MGSDATGTSNVLPSAATEPAKPPRVWPAVVLVALYWAVHLAVGSMEISMFAGFLVRMGALALVTLLFIIWWLTNGGISWTDRLMAFGAAILAGVIAISLSHNSVIGASVVFVAVPILLTAWTVWILVARRMSARVRRIGLFAMLVVVWGPAALIRMEGLAGDGNPTVRWRWSRNSEDLFLAQRVPSNRNANDGQVSLPSPEAMLLQSGDWPGFRGADRSGVVHGVKIQTDWKTAPPTLIWRQRGGPSWSSFAVVGNRLFTQEQRGESEAVVCIDAATGREVWAHQDAVRFAEALGGVGPRATPTFADGLVYALGATGVLNCLDAATGERKWSKDITADSGAKVPMWGFSSSPLVMNGMVIVFAAGESQQNLLAYRTESGELVWTAPAGHDSYCSAQLESIGGQDQILLFSDIGLVAVDPSSGSVLWQHAMTNTGEQHTLQPHVVGEYNVLCSAANSGTMLLNLTRDGDDWHTKEQWTSRDLKPFFNDYVIHDGSIYGFDGSIFCCVDWQTGKRRWKQGRYGNGQVLLLADQHLLLVLAENGEVVLLAANPRQHEEMGRFQAIEGKTWNHPVIAHGRLYVRNAEEMACYQLALDETDSQ